MLRFCYLILLNFGPITAEPAALCDGSECVGEGLILAGVCRVLEFWRLEKSTEVIQSGFGTAEAEAGAGVEALPCGCTGVFASPTVVEGYVPHF